ncbi:exodeoxyribonuclease VII small subunit [Fictibacillus macauensis ZFHKF-1]|uniref:Exodeoxyribonuclease 7 small subunit n=1 Tax=Fictibacillus macauensis ZFHKF-1 TaxID=1196324 RepID=I8ANE6_9BACL|nr:exodeoxyribonuclease VII small subunit [Fictibacillus macauensis]EIT87324.1 exodeoxyribonuclease VII small subunit [Fictibacillus macauensis ZFHKF-1]
MTDQQPLTFEEAMKQLEDIVDSLEEGDVPLEKSIELFQQGMELSKTCHTKLQNIEKKMDVIMNENGEASPFILKEEEN